MNYAIWLDKIEVFKKIIDRLKRELLRRYIGQLNSTLMNPEGNIMGVFLCLQPN